ncbi:Uncharacterized protein HA466_0089450 [Hirschfeldia incana]|nr:Uncharacterized protein HA466_0089450 [Hirschfeldia incana]
MDSKHQTSTSKPKNKNKLLKMIPRAMSFGHRVPPFSPGRDLHHHQHNTTSSSSSNKAYFSGPMVPLVPKAARVRKNKSDAVWSEPTSPKVSCIGQIKRVKSKRSSSPKKSRAAIPKIPKKTSSSSLTKGDEKGRPSMIKRLFSFTSAAGGGNSSRKSHPNAVAEHPVTVVSSAAVPSLGQMKKFASSREGLGGFDWAVEMKREEESPADRGYYSDDERRGGFLRDDDEEEEDDIIIPFSAPLMSLKPKTEVNLWKRRTMDPPKPLHLQTS